MFQPVFPSVCNIFSIVSSENSPFLKQVNQKTRNELWKLEKEICCSLTGSGNEFHPSKRERGKLWTDFKEQIK
jgi:hypothetical protein